MKSMKYALLWMFMWSMIPAWSIAADQTEHLSLDVDVVHLDGTRQSLHAYIKEATVLHLFLGTDLPGQVDHPIWHVLHRKGISCVALCMDPASRALDDVFPFTVLRAADNRVYEAYRTQDLPISVLVDPGGDIRYRGSDPLALLVETEGALETDIDESTWAKIKELFR